MLLDLKSTSQGGVAGRRELYQLLGYLLADTHGEWGITRVGFFALRRRRGFSWSVHEFGDELGCRPGVFSLKQMRAESADMLAPSAKEREDAMGTRDVADE